LGAYADALAHLYALEPRGIRLGLDRVRAGLGLLGDPHVGLPVIHVAGSNGKGSVAAMLSAVLARAGYRTGLYTSPHLHRFVERIRIDGRPVREGEVVRGVGRLRRALATPGAPELTFFECATLLAFDLFRERQCDVAVLEVGLGGRLDATNVVEAPAVCVITQLTLEHTDRLGDTLAAVAREKAGILKKGVPAVVTARAPEARRVIAARARRLGVPVLWLDRDFAVEGEGRRVTVRVGDMRVEGVPVPLAGEHQRHNLAAVVAAVRTLEARGFPVSAAALREGLSRVRWPGRIEQVRGRPPVLLDAAHNPDGCAALARHLDRLPPGRRVLLFGAMADKDHERMLACFDGRVDERVFTAPDVGRAADPRDLARLRPGRVVQGVRKALTQARRAAGARGLVVVAGSIFVMAEARAALFGCRADPPIAM
jgi:dihydrofolate synthase / folylpolyglutamate synthase